MLENSLNSVEAFIEDAARVSILKLEEGADSQSLLKRALSQQPDVILIENKTSFFDFVLSLIPTIKKTINRKCTHDEVRRILMKEGFEIQAALSVIPSLNSPRFIFYNKDIDSYRFLLRNVLLPKRYSLSVELRICLILYSYLINSCLGKLVLLFQPQNYLIARKNV